jgi:hypothetical protein
VVDRELAVVFKGLIGVKAGSFGADVAFEYRHDLCLRVEKVSHSVDI